MAHVSNKRLRILQITPEYPPYNLGGGGIIVKNLSQGLAKKGFKITVASGYYPVKGWMDQPITNFAENIKIEWLPLIPTPKTGFQLKTIMPPNLFGLVRLLKIFFHGDFDIVHIHGFGHNVCDLAAILCRITHKPYILTIHGFPKEPERRGGYLNIIYQLYSKTLGTHLIKKAKQTVAISRSSAKELLKYLQQEKISIINNAVNFQCYNSIHPSAIKKLLQKYNLLDKEIILCIGRLSIAKGFQYAIRALPSVIKQVPTAQLLIIGKDEGYGYLKELNEIVKQENMKRHVSFLGGVSDEEKNKILLAASVVLIPSIEEAFGIVALEAMAAHKPIIATKIGGLQEILSFDMYSLLVEPRNSNQISEGLINVLLDKDLRLRAEKNSARRLDRFKFETLVNQYIEIYVEKRLETA